MRQFVESIGRLYADGKIGTTLIQKLLSDGKVSQEEYEYIVSLKP